MLRHLLSAPPPAIGASTLEACLALENPGERSLERALWAGFHVDRLGFAFVGGYRAAPRSLFGSDSLSLAATETGGGHPKAIHTTLMDNHLRGEKTFATMASHAKEIVVVAKVGEEAGKNRLALVRVLAKDVTIENRPPTPFAPEIPHAKVTLDLDVTTEQVLPGDGYDNYLKPFRTIEDTHVLAAALGYLIRSARLHEMNPAIVVGATAIGLTLERVVEMKPTDPVAHLALAGAFTEARRLIAEHDAEWEKAPSDERDRWRRDLGLLMVAEQVRQKRTEAAFATLRATSP